MTDFNALSCRIRQARAALDITQAELARRVGTTENRVCDWEQGEGMHLASFEKLCRALKVSANWLLGLEE